MDPEVGKGSYTMNNRSRRGSPYSVRANSLVHRHVTWAPNGNHAGNFKNSSHHVKNEKETGEINLNNISFNQNVANTFEMIILTCNRF